MDLKDGEMYQMKGSAKKPYELKNTGGVYSCSCPAWRNQSLPIEKRTCKHLRKLRGEQAEQDRVGGDLPTTSKAKATKAKDASPVLLAHNWDNNTDLTHWWMSEKLDGVRAYWNGTQLLSRQGNPFHAPDWFLKDLPSHPLDGELWLDRKAFQKTISIVKRQDKSDRWKEIKYVVFDAPAHDGTFEKRIDYLKGAFPNEQPYASVLSHEVCEGLEHLKEELARVENLGGEGLMMRKPKSIYESGRSHTLLKIKTFHDAEATVLAHISGKGRHKGRLGAVSVQLENGTQFSVGTGFSDAERENPPSVGTVITFRYQELTDTGVPRFPSFLRIREDL